MQDEQNDTVSTLDLQNLEVLWALGRGAKGVVFLVKSQESHEFLALKVVCRDSIEKKKKDLSDGCSEYKRICFEQQVLRRFNHPFLPRLHGVLLTEKIVGYAIDYCPGRDLNVLRKKQTEKMFSVDIIRFYAAELVLALEYLHKLGIAYRDLKPENIMIQENGHVMLVDFDLSTNLTLKSPQTSPPPKSVQKSNAPKKKRYSPFHNCCNSGISPEDSVSPAELGAGAAKTESDSGEKSNSFVGTEEYVAPEIILGHGHDFAVDWWSLGIVLYEMLYGATPFRGSNRKETFYRILKMEPKLVGETTPLRDMIRKLLEKDPKQRIGVEEIKGHDFFKGVDWDMILRISRPPYIPTRSETELESGDREGKKKIDVEIFVQGIFEATEDERNKGNENNENDNGKNVNEKVWVKGPNDPSDHFSNF